MILSCLLALAMCAPASPDDHSLRNLPALRHEEIRDEYGQYSIRYITAEGKFNVNRQMALKLNLNPVF